MNTLDHCVYLLLMARLEKERARCRMKERSGREKNPAKYLAKEAAYRKRNSGKTKAATRKWRLANREHIKAYSKTYRENHLTQCQAKGKEHYYKNREAKMASHTVYCRERRKVDPDFKLVVNLRNRITIALRKGYKKAARTSELIGCPVQQLRTHLEKQFTPGMSWQNYGQWHVDHIRPCASFDLTQPEQQRQCFRYTNLQPLWAKDNLSKGARK